MTTTIGLDAIKTIKEIFDLCEKTPEYNRDKDQAEEAKRLDSTITDIHSLCDDILSNSTIKDLLSLDSDV